jgi:hypothetical protein
MPDTQSTLYAQQFGANIMQLAQQKYSKLLNTVYVKPSVSGKVFFQDQIGAWSMQVKGGRNVATPNNDPAMARRMGTLIDYHDNRMLDRGDEIRMISDPRSAYTIAAASSIGRQIDTSILSAAIGTANYGETGSSTVTMSQVVTTTAGALTLAQLAAVKKNFDDNDVEMEERYFIISPATLSEMLQVNAMTSADYAAVKALVRGEIDTFMGFKFITSTLVTSVCGATYSGVAWQKNGVCLGMATSPLVKTDIRTDLSYSWQVYYELNLGGVRLEEKKVVAAKA